MHEQEIKDFMIRTGWEPTNPLVVVFVLLLAVLVPIVVLRVLAMVH